MARKVSKEERMTDAILLPAVKVYGFIRKVALKTQNTFPYLYKEVGKMMRSHFVVLGKKEGLLHKPDLKNFGDTVAKNLAKKLPNLSDNQIDKIIRGRSSKSFLDMLTVGLGELQ